MMKKALTSLSLSVTVLLASNGILNTQKSLNLFKGFFIYPKLSGLVKQGKLKMKAKTKDGYYIIKLFGENGQKGNLYLSENKKYIIIGNVLKKNGMPLNFRLPVNAKTVKKGVLFSYGKGKKTIYLVTDPQCPFCRMLESKNGQTLKEHYRVKVILFPLPFHRYAKAMSYYILAGKTDAEKAKRLLAILGGSNEWKNFHPTKAQLKQFNEELKNAKNAVKTLQAEGTPSVFNSNFKPVNPFELK